MLSDGSEFKPLYDDGSESSSQAMLVVRPLREGSGGASKGAPLVSGQEDLLWWYTSTCGVVMGGWHWVEMMVILSKG